MPSSIAAVRGLFPIVLLSLALAGCGKTDQAAPSAPAETGADLAPPQSSGAGHASPEQAAKLLAELPAPYNAADLANGQRQFALCRSCHTATAGGPDLIGPNLHDVFGRKAASKPGYRYSDALKAKSMVWDAATLDAWLLDPRAFVPGTKMTFLGVKDAKDRTDLIAFLKVQTSLAPPA
jgi:cytochrome c